MEIGGLVITKAVYGNPKALRSIEHGETKKDVASHVLDVTVPLSFLVGGPGTLKLHEGIKKSGIMGFYDPCPGESKHLLVDYTFNGQNYQVVVDDYEELLIPQEKHTVDHLQKVSSP